jgi:hypothetical protein
MTNTRLRSHHQEYSFRISEADEERPERIDVWRGVEWLGQWDWNGTHIGNRRQASRFKCADEVLRAIETQIEADQ